MDKIIKKISTVDLSKLTAGALNDIINNVNSNFQAVVNSPVMQGLQGATPEIKKFTFSSSSTDKKLKGVYDIINNIFKSVISEKTALFPSQELESLTDWAWWCVTAVDGTSYIDYPLFPACSYTVNMSVNADNAGGGISAVQNKCVIYASGVGDSYATADVKDKALSITFTATPGAVPFINAGYWIINGDKSAESAQGPKGEPGVSSEIKMCRMIAVEDNAGTNKGQSNVFVCDSVNDILTNNYPQSDQNGLKWTKINGNASDYDGHLMMISTGIWKAATDSVKNIDASTLDDYFATNPGQLKINYDKDKGYYLTINNNNINIDFYYTNEFVQMNKCIAQPDSTAKLSAVGLPFNDAFIRIGIDTYLGRFLTKSDIVTGFAHKANSSDVSGMAMTSLLAEDVTNSAGKTETCVTKTDSVKTADGTKDISGVSTHADMYGHVKSALSDETSFDDNNSYKCNDIKVDAASSSEATLHLLGIDDSQIAGTAETIRKVGLDNIITAIKDAIVPKGAVVFYEGAETPKDWATYPDTIKNILTNLAQIKKKINIIALNSVNFKDTGAISISTKDEKIQNIIKDNKLELIASDDSDGTSAEQFYIKDYAVKDEYQNLSLNKIYNQTTEAIFTKSIIALYKNAKTLIGGYQIQWYNTKYNLDKLNTLNTTGLIYADSFRIFLNIINYDFSNCLPDSNLLNFNILPVSTSDDYKKKYNAKNFFDVTNDDYKDKNEIYCNDFLYLHAHHDNDLSAWCLPIYKNNIVKPTDITEPIIFKGLGNKFLGKINKISSNITTYSNTCYGTIDKHLDKMTRYWGCYPTKAYLTISENSMNYLAQSYINNENTINVVKALTMIKKQ